MIFFGRSDRQDLQHAILKQGNLSRKYGKHITYKIEINSHPKVGRDLSQDSPLFFNTNNLFKVGTRLILIFESLKAYYYLSA